jgi:hypothetical protein
VPIDIKLVCSIFLNFNYAFPIAPILTMQENCSSKKQLEHQELLQKLLAFQQ